MTFGKKLLVLHTRSSCWVSFWCVLGGSDVEVETKNILYLFMKRQTHVFGMPKRSSNNFWSLLKDQIGCFSFRFKDYLRTCIITSWKLERKKLLIFYAKTKGVIKE